VFRVRQCDWCGGWRTGFRPRSNCGSVGSELAGSGESVEHPADRLDPHEQPDGVLEVPGPGKVPDPDGVVAGVPDELLSDLDGLVVRDVPVAWPHALFAYLVEQLREVPSKRGKLMLKLLATTAPVKDFTSSA
jgi:hypothetical protein